MDVDIYGDIENFDFGEQLETVRAENKELRNIIQQLQKKHEDFAMQLTQLKTANVNLEYNISLLYGTAKAEFDRKNKQITELRKQVDSYGFYKCKKANKVPDNIYEELRQENDGAKKHIDLKNRIIVNLNKELVNLRNELKEKNIALKRDGSHFDIDAIQNSKRQKLQISENERKERVHLSRSPELDSHHFKRRSKFLKSRSDSKRKFTHPDSCRRSNFSRYSDSFNSSKYIRPSRSRSRTPMSENKFKSPKKFKKNDEQLKPSRSKSLSAKKDDVEAKELITEEVKNYEEKLKAKKISFFQSENQNSNTKSSLTEDVIDVNSYDENFTVYTKISTQSENENIAAKSNFDKERKKDLEEVKKVQSAQEIIEKCRTDIDLSEPEEGELVTFCNNTEGTSRLEKDEQKMIKKESAILEKCREDKTSNKTNSIDNYKTKKRKDSLSTDPNYPKLNKETIVDHVDAMRTKKHQTLNTENPQLDDKYKIPKKDTKNENSTPLCKEIKRNESDCKIIKDDSQIEIMKGEKDEKNHKIDRSTKSNHGVTEKKTDVSSNKKKLDHGEVKAKAETKKELKLTTHSQVENKAGLEELEIIELEKERTVIASEISKLDKLTKDENVEKSLSANKDVETKEITEEAKNYEEKIKAYKISVFHSGGKSVNTKCTFLKDVEEVSSYEEQLSAQSKNKNISAKSNFNKGIKNDVEVIKVHSVKEIEDTNFSETEEDELDNSYVDDTEDKFRPEKDKQKTHKKESVTLEKCNENKTSIKTNSIDNYKIKKRKDLQNADTNCPKLNKDTNVDATREKKHQTLKTENQQLDNKFKNPKKQTKNENSGLLCKEIKTNESDYKIIKRDPRIEIIKGEKDKKSYKIDRSKVTEKSSNKKKIDPVEVKAKTELKLEANSQIENTVELDELEIIELEKQMTVITSEITKLKTKDEKVKKMSVVNEEQRKSKLREISRLGLRTGKPRSFFKHVMEYEESKPSTSLNQISESPVTENKVEETVPPNIIDCLVPETITSPVNISSEVSAISLNNSVETNSAPLNNSLESGETNTVARKPALSGRRGRCFITITKKN